MQSITSFTSRKYFEPRIERGHRAADAAEIAAYRLRMWFEAHCKFSFFEAPGGRIQLRRRGAQ